MTFEEFRNSLSGDQPPASLEPRTCGIVVGRQKTTGSALTNRHNRMKARRDPGSMRTCIAKKEIYRTRAIGTTALRRQFPKYRCSRNGKRSQKRYSEVSRAAAALKPLLDRKQLPYKIWRSASVAGSLHDSLTVTSATRRRVTVSSSISRDLNLTRSAESRRIASFPIASAPIANAPTASCSYRSCAERNCADRCRYNCGRTFSLLF